MHAGAIGGTDDPHGAEIVGLKKWWFARPVRTKGLMVVAAPILVLVLVVGLGLNLLAQERSERLESGPTP